MSVVSVNEEQFSEKVLAAEKPVLVDFWAPWCGPCRQLAPMLEDISAAHPEIAVVKVNVDEEGALAQRYGIASVPSLLLFRQGEMKNRAVGLQPRSAIERMIG
jgi:thioredoxin 1